MTQHIVLLSAYRPIGRHHHFRPRCRRFGPESATRQVHPLRRWPHTVTLASSSRALLSTPNVSWPSHSRLVMVRGLAASSRREVGLHGTYAALQTSTRLSLEPYCLVLRMVRCTCTRRAPCVGSTHACAEVWVGGRVGVHARRQAGQAGQSGRGVPRASDHVPLPLPLTLSSLIPHVPLLPLHPQPGDPIPSIPAAAFVRHKCPLGLRPISRSALLSKPGHHTRTGHRTPADRTPADDTVPSQGRRTGSPSSFRSLSSPPSGPSLATSGQLHYPSPIQFMPSHPQTPHRYPFLASQSHPSRPRRRCPPLPCINI